MLVVLGLILAWCLYGAYRGYARTVKNMNQLEEELGIGVFTKNYRSDTAPYFLLMLFGIVCCLIAAVYFSQEVPKQGITADKPLNAALTPKTNTG